MSRRCYSEELIAGESTTLAGGEAHHLLHVLRAAPGMRVTLFDGSGNEFEAEVKNCGRSTVDLAILQRRPINRELPFSLTLGVALPKGDRQRWIVEKAVELGVTRLVPLITERSVGATEKHVGQKLARYVIEASKQCGRNRLMEIAEPLKWADWLQLASADVGAADSSLGRKWIAHPTGRPIRPEELAMPRPTQVAIGPEGGLTDEETAAAEANGWELVGLGSRILRIETAAIALVSLLTLPAQP